MPGNGVSGRSKPSENSYSRIYAVVRSIPAGRVATYGQIATLAGLPGHARQVGYALNALPDGQNIPWHRVINSQGKISQRDSAEIQRCLLEEEGVVFNERVKVDLKVFGWDMLQGRE